MKNKKKLWSFNGEADGVKTIGWLLATKNELDLFCGAQYGGGNDQSTICTVELEDFKEIASDENTMDEMIARYPDGYVDGFHLREAIKKYKKPE